MTASPSPLNGSACRSLLTAGLLAASLAGPASAQTVTFNFTTLDPLAKSFVTCTTTDRCATGAGNAMSFTTSGMTVLASGLTRSSTGVPTGATVMQDYNGTTAMRWAGLGVYPAGPSPVASTDNIALNDVLKLDFGSQLVSLNSLKFYNGTHGSTFDTSGKWGFSTTAPVAGGSFLQYAFAANGLQDIPDTRASTFYIYGLSDASNRSFYLAEVNVTAVPEPGTLALMAAGLGLVSTVSRRRQAARRG
jgi:hypothetical protein